MAADKVASDSGEEPQPKAAPAAPTNPSTAADASSAAAESATPPAGSPPAAESPRPEGASPPADAPSADAPESAAPPAFDAKTEPAGPAAATTAESSTPAIDLSLVDLMREHQNLMLAWFQAVRGDVGILYQRLEQFAADLAARQAISPSTAPAVAPPPVPPAQAAGEPDLVQSAVGAITQVFGTPSSHATEPTPAPGGGQVNSAARWEGLVFGAELASIDALATRRRELIRGLMEEEPAALALAGQLMIFRASSGERLPVLLKDLGEAYYRWHPASAGSRDEFRDRLIAWMQRQCDRGGCSMKIELVQPGDRFDSKRHNARDPGVEVTEVFGWVVLRDNGKVYTKANVAVK